MYKNEKIWESVKEIVKALHKFDTNIEQMQELHASSNIDLTDLSGKKEECKKALFKEANPIINVLKVYSKDVKDKSLQGKIILKKEKLDDLKDRKMIEYCKTILKESRKHYNNAISGDEKNKTKVQECKSILNYGLSGMMIDNLEEECHNFENAFIVYSETKSHKNKTIQKIKLLAKTNQYILKNKLDLLVSIFETSEADFYKLYKTVRKIKKIDELKEKNKKVVPVKQETKTKSKLVKKEKEPEVIKEIEPVVVVETKKVPVKRKPRNTSVAKTSTPKTPVEKKVRATSSRVKDKLETKTPRTPRKKVIKETVEQKEVTNTPEN